MDSGTITGTTAIRLIVVGALVLSYRSRADLLGNIGLPEILLISVVAVLLFGADKIVEIGTGLSEGIDRFLK